MSARREQPLAIDLYCGLGGWTDGLLAEGWGVIGFDIERHVYGKHRYPGQLVVQDVLTLDGAQFKDADLIVASPPCFVADTLILTARGLVPIPEVIVGDLVLTHRCRWQRVTRTGSTLASTFIATGYGGSLEGTAEHPIYARHDVGSRQVWDKEAKGPIYQPKELAPPTWTPLSKIEGSHWGAPHTFDSLPTPDLPNQLPDTAAFWWMVGRWVGDGWTRHRDGQGDEVIICCAHDEADDLEGALSSIAPRSGKRAGLGELHWRRSRERTTARFTAASNSLARWFVDHFGKGAGDKSWPAWVLGMDRASRQAMLNGYASADGYNGSNGPSRITKVTTVSKALALSTRMLAASLGVTANVFFSRRPPTGTIQGRAIQQRDTWQVSWTPGNKNNRLVERAYGHLWGKVRNVAPAQEVARVWNLEVAGDNSYIADGFTVHNCQEYSYMAMPWTRAKRIARALRGKGEFTEGYKGSRSVEDLNRLFDACFRIQREACEAAGRHIPMVVENVKGAQPWVGRAAWNFGSYYLWGDVPALMPIIRRGGVKAPGMNWSDQTKRGQDFTRLAGQHATKNPGFRFDGSGRSFQSESVNRHTKNTGGSWFGDYEAMKAGVKQRGSGREWFAGDGKISRMTSSGSPARKAASAMIAKIPFELSRHVAAVYRPERAP